MVLIAQIDYNNYNINAIWLLTCLLYVGNILDFRDVIRFKLFVYITYPYMVEVSPEPEHTPQAEEDLLRPKQIILRTKYHFCYN